MHENLPIECRESRKIRQSSPRLCQQILYLYLQNVCPEWVSNGYKKPKPLVTETCNLNFIFFAICLRMVSTYNTISIIDIIIIIIHRQRREHLGPLHTSTPGARVRPHQRGRRRWLLPPPPRRHQASEGARSAVLPVLHCLVKSAAYWVQQVSGVPLGE